MRKPLAFAAAFLATLAVALIPLARDRSPPMRPRRAAPALAILAAACLAAPAAACTGNAAPSATPTAAPTPTTATQTPVPTPSATPTATPPTATATPTPATKRYDRLDPTGEAATPGSWAILGADGGVLTTWEGLRSDAATLRLHQTDAGGASLAAAYGGVEAGDIVEWRKADDCWVRYRVTGAPTRPASGSSRWEFPVEWMTYAATGAGCTGAVGAATVLRVDEGAPTVIPVSGITSPVRHGPYLVYPRSWTGALETEVRLEPPTPTPVAGGASGSSATATATPDPVVQTSEPAEARRLFPYWRDPVLPAGWSLAHAESGTHTSPTYGYCASYRNDRGYVGAKICAYYKIYRPGYSAARSHDGSVVYEPRVIDGRAALVMYSPQGPEHDRLLGVAVWIYDAETGIEYEVVGYDRNFRGSNVDPVIAIARSLLPAVGAP